MDKNSALDAFRQYVSAYDPSNPRIALKVSHTIRVAALCERIAREIGLPAEDIDMAWLLGLLHDIGRFEQVSRFDSYNDAATVNHAALGAQVLFGDAPVIRRFLADDAHDDLIQTAVLTHSAYRLPDDLPARTRMLCEILRDADKIDILKVNCVSPIEDVYSVSERDMLESDLSPECVDMFYQHRCLPRDVRKYPADILLGHVCFAWELVHEQSIAIVREQGHLNSMLERPWLNPTTKKAFENMSLHMKQELNI